MSVFKQLMLVAILFSSGMAFYVFAWPLVVSADGYKPAQNVRGGGGAAIVVVRTVELRPERTRIKAVGTARAVRAVTLYAATAGEVAGVNNLAEC